jgi:hypothetical protein
MNITVKENHFSTRDEALLEISEAGLFPLEMFVAPVKNTSHWHDFSTIIFIVEGELKITDVASQNILVAGRGSRVTVPERVLHAEESAVGYRIIAGMSVDPASLAGEVDLPPDSL